MPHNICHLFQPWISDIWKAITVYGRARLTFTPHPGPSCSLKTELCYHCKWGMSKQALSRWLPLLPMILVRNEIRDMLGGETGKFTCRKNKVKSGTSSKRISLLVQYILVQCNGADCKVTGIKFMAVFVMRRDAACS